MESNMKQITILLVLCILFFGCKQVTENNKTSDSEIKSEINNLIDNWHKNAAETNLEKYFEIMDDNFVFVGTDGTEYWTKSEFREFCTPYFEKGKAWDFKTMSRNIYISNDKNTVWFDEILDTELGPCRGSGVFDKVDGKWLIHHYVLSMLVSNDDVKEVLKVKSENDSVFLTKNLH